MPRKYIKIKYLSARVPFRQCVVQFVVRRVELDPVHCSEVQFYAKAISLTLDENIELVYGEKHLNSLAVYLIAINPENRVANIGFVPLRLAENCMEKKEKLRGLGQQTGHIIYSMQDEPFPRMSHLLQAKISNSSSEGAESRVNLGKLDVKRSEFAADIEEKLQQSKVETFQVNENEQKAIEKTLKRSREGLPNLTIKTNNPAIKKQAKQEIAPIIQQRSNRENLMPKSELADEIGISDEPEQQNCPQLHIPPAPSSVLNEHEQLQSFIIDILRHKLRNSEYMLMIKRNAEFLQQQQARFELLVHSTSK